MTLEAVVELQPSGNGTASQNGHGPSARVLADTLPSQYLRYLPGIYSEDPFIGRFLRVFEEILSPLQTTVDNRAQLFDPSLAPPPMLAHLAQWVGADLVGRLQETAARRFARATVALHQLRGSKRGLRLALELATGKRPYITEYSDGLVLGEDAVLGLNTALSDGRPLQVQVLFDCREDEVDTSLVHAIIRRYKPAETVYALVFAR